MFLKAELETMYVFLQKMSDIEEPDVQDKCWANEVRELSYDMEDSINEFMLQVECESSSKPHGFRGFINRSMNLLTTMNTRQEVAKEFEGLKRRVMEVRERHKRYKVDDAVSKPNNATIDRRLLALYAEPAGLVGINGPREELIQLMAEQGVHANQLKVLAIVGFGGLGKTTLANEIYRQLEGQFQCRALVSVSHKPNIRKILRTMLLQAGFVAPEHTNMEIWDEPELIAALRKFLLVKRYFIVIDDIWDTSTWDVIRCALPENRNGSRIITTTRIETVGRECCAYHDEYVYKMKPLSDQDSRSLLYKRIFGSEDACPPYLKEVSAEILKKCGGLPLAIITISSLLASQPKNLKEQWEHVRNSLGSNSEWNPSLEGMREILNLSYINLPHYLKTCMLYLGIYPEDYTINKNDLARQWVAEGFISTSLGAVPEDVAKSFFNELVNRSMIQPTNVRYNGEVISCRVHDIMLDLILQKSREENFITVIDRLKDISAQHKKIRRLSLQLDGAIEDNTIAGSVQLSQIRTLAIFGIYSCLPPFLLVKHLRVLNIEISKRSQPSALLDLTGICHLLQLRYLKIIANSHHVVLPTKIGSLQQLETFQVSLIIKSTFSSGPLICKLPSDISHMSRLLHLIAPKWRGLPDEIGNMKFLRTLCNFELGMSSLDSTRRLRELTNLIELRIGCNFACNLYSVPRDEVVARGREVLHACLEKLCNLKCLYIDSDCGDLDVLISVPASSCHLQRFHAPSFLRVPDWIGQLHNLYDLKLTVKVLEDDVGMLAQLPCLTELGLVIRSAPEYNIIIRESVFFVLKLLKVTCNKISCLTFEAGAMARLEWLKLRFNAHGWDRHGAAPAGIEHLSGLKGISVDIGAHRAKESNIRAAHTALRNAIDMHPGRPTAKIKRYDNERIGFDDMDGESEE